MEKRLKINADYLNYLKVILDYSAWAEFLIKLGKTRAHGGHYPGVQWVEDSKNQRRSHSDRVFDEW